MLTQTCFRISQSHSDNIHRGSDSSGIHSLPCAVYVPFLFSCSYTNILFLFFHLFIHARGFARANRTACSLCTGFDTGLPLVAPITAPPDLSFRAAHNLVWAQQTVFSDATGQAVPGGHNGHNILLRIHTYCAHPPLSLLFPARNIICIMWWLIWLLGKLDNFTK